VGLPDFLDHFGRRLLGKAVRNRNAKPPFQIFLQADPFAFELHLAGPGADGDNLPQVFQPEQDGDNGDERDGGHAHENEGGGLVEQQSGFGSLFPRDQQIRLLFLHSEQHAAGLLDGVPAPVGRWCRDWRPAAGR